MSKELKALKRIKSEAGIPYFSSLYDIDMWKQDFDILEKALKRNESVKLLKNESTQKYEWLECYMPIGKCSMCNETNPIFAKYCHECGHALEKIQDGEFDE